MSLRVGRALLLLNVLALLSASAHAEAPGYSYVEGGYVNLDRASVGGDGWFFGGSFGTKNLLFRIEYDSFDLGTSGDQALVLLGAGWHGLLGEKADIVVDGGYARSEFDGTGLSSDDSGYYLRGGARWRIVDLFELDGFVERFDLASSETFIRIDALLTFRAINIGLAYLANDDDQFRTYIRWNFGQR